MSLNTLLFRSLHTAYRKGPALIKINFETKSCTLSPVKAGKNVQIDIDGGERQSLAHYLGRKGHLKIVHVR